MRKLFIWLILMSALTLAQVGTAVELEAGESYDVSNQGQWLEVAVYDTGDADTITVWYPYTSTIIGAGVHYAAMGSIQELATGDYVAGLYGDADMKIYTLWVPSPRAVRFTLSADASGDVEIKAYKKP